jgi:hypothetical protein
LGFHDVGRRVRGNDRWSRARLLFVRLAAFAKSVLHFRQ